jgi:RNA polymerase sigma factor (sigma-70 family)
LNLIARLGNKVFEPACDLGFVMLRLTDSNKRAMVYRTLDDAVVDENVLLERIVQRDMAAYEIFFKAYYQRLYRFILRMTHSQDSVEELIQETMMVVWNKPEGFNHSCKISTWVFGIAYNKALKSMATEMRRANDLDVDEMVEILGDPGSNQAKTHENEDWLKCALASLPPDQRAVVELTLYHDLPYQEIAKILDCPENTVKTRMFHARKKLQIFAETHGD